MHTRQICYGSLNTFLSVQLSGAAEEATAVFGETAALSIQKQYMQQLSASLGLNTYNEERNSNSTKDPGSEDYSLRQSKHTQSHGLKRYLWKFRTSFYKCLRQWLHR
ncbi:hypothetical protein ARALYDRAFT_893926 [Arabidopsis lyrata subsp. lyrata]|uniref:Uncharacterized protein n=1 Tax=Arabidopsis lyrata subsp. lyrata TaxID=81972 RepID=D7KQZ3_ARALL|nr:hypothetical protein ARALYDRAFT_893926 [Arabidopsis lyrata subsp. lyrata]